MYKKDNYYWAKVSYTRVGYEWLIAKYVGEDMWGAYPYSGDLPTDFFDEIIDKPMEEKAAALQEQKAKWNHVEGEAELWDTFHHSIDNEGFAYHIKKNEVLDTFFSNEGHKIKFKDCQLLVDLGIM